jgi:hypothetical protein
MRAPPREDYLSLDDRAHRWKRRLSHWEMMVSVTIVKLGVGRWQIVDWWMGGRV